MNWIETDKNQPPKKPGLKKYEQVECLVIRDRVARIMQWNCEHLCWDDEDGDELHL